MNKPELSAIVIGAGIGGLASAIRLAVKGYSVTIFEASGHPGGKMGRFVNEGFTFDTGPSLFTLPCLVDELFQLAGKDPAEYLQYDKMRVITRYFWEDGGRLDAYSDPEKFIYAAAECTGEPIENIRKSLENCRVKYELTEEIFLKKSLHKTDTWLSKKAFSTFFQLPKLDIFRTMQSANQAAFQTEKMQQLFNRFATYNGSDPSQAPATLNVIPHLEHNLGAYFAQGGMYSIALALEQLAKDLGVQFEYNHPVRQILVFDQKVKGIYTTKGIYTAKLVVSNADIYYTFRKLMPEQKAPERLLRQPRSSSALIFYWGMDKQFPQLETHNIFFSTDTCKEFEVIFKEKSIAIDPTVYLYISAKQSEDHAPKGCENWFVMINVPHDEDQDWCHLVKIARINILAKLSRILGVNPKHHIVNERVWDPRGIEAETSSWKGALYGNSSNNKFSAFLRHPNFSNKIKGLYFTGGSVHPGGGIPLCLLSAKIALDDLEEAKLTINSDK